MWPAVLCVLVIGITATAHIINYPVLQPGEDTSILLRNASLSYNKNEAQLTSINEYGVDIPLVCKTCEIHGEVLIYTTGIKRSPSFSNLIKEWQTHPLSPLNSNPESVNKIFHEKASQEITSKLLIKFANTSASFNISTTIKDSGIHAFNLYTLPTSGYTTYIDGDDSIGINIRLDLILNVNASTTINWIFEFSMPDGAFILVDPIHASILQHSGFSVKNFHTTISLEEKSEIDFTASLRVTAVAGIEINEKSLDAHADFDVGVFVDLVKYGANITSEESLTLSGNLLPARANTTVNSPYPMNGTAGTGNETACANILTESFSMDVGAFKTAADNVAEAEAQFDRPGQIVVYTHSVAPRCWEEGQVLDAVRSGISDISL